MTAVALRHRIRWLLNRYCRRGIAVGGFDDMFITCACTLSSSSHDAPLVLQAEELAGAQRCRCQQRHTKPLQPRTFRTARRHNCCAGAKWVSIDELETSGAPGSVSAAIVAPAASWVRGRSSGDTGAGMQRSPVLQGRQLGKVPGASVFFSSCL